MTILLKEIWPIENTSEYKIHFARHNNENVEPLDVFVRSRSEWQRWQEYHMQNNNFNLPYIFALMQFYHEPETWLFGGVYRVLERFKVSKEHEPKKFTGYKVELADIRKNFIGRLKIKHDYKGEAARLFMESPYSEFEVKEILLEPYKQ